MYCIFIQKISTESIIDNGKLISNKEDIFKIPKEAYDKLVKCYGVDDISPPLIRYATKKNENEYDVCLDVKLFNVYVKINNTINKPERKFPIAAGSDVNEIKNQVCKMYIILIQIKN